MGKLTIAALALLLAACSQESGSPTAADAAPQPAAKSTGASGDDAWRQPLFDGLGNFELAITTSSDMARRYFNQGLGLAFGFNHAAADFAFTEATVDDPDCAMCYWGSALVLGPNVNAAMDPGNAPRAWVLAGKAHDLAMTHGNAKEQALTAALMARYAETAPEDRSSLDQAYADAMRAVAAAYPDDPDVLALTAEALMDLHPWDFWLPDGTIQPWTAEITGLLETALAIDDNHPGAIHLYIHAVEQSQTPERAEPYADKLADITPAAGHLVHMPAHIYMRVGRYHDSTVNNMKATDADTAFVSACRSNSPIYLAGYVPHNWHFGWITAAIEGWRAQALDMAEGTAAQLTPELLRAPGMGVAQHFLMQPIFAHVRFGDWDAILAAPEPDADLPYARGIWHYARGRALAAKGDLDGARQQAALLAALRESPELNDIAFFVDTEKAPRVLEIADEFLNGEIAAADGDLEAGIAHMTRAVALEDALPYNEPPDWYYPARHSLGAMQLAAGDAAGAEATYRRDLELMRENGWALKGLELALRAQGRDAEAEAVAARFADAWQHADVQITGSRI
ncbi:MAG: hypothetical protein R3E86_05365 [Pseudomonadales bacterium]